MTTSSETSYAQRVTRPYRIGWWTHAWWPTQRLVAGLLTGKQSAPSADGRRHRIGRRRFAEPLLRRLRSIRCPHRPWQAESDALWFARRSFTAAGAERKVLADVAHHERHGLPSPYQYWRLLRKARRHASESTRDRVLRLVGTPTK